MIHLKLQGVIFLVIINFSVSAQNIFYIKPFAGMGFSNIISRSFSTGISTFPSDNHLLKSYDGGVAIGHRMGNVDISTGIQILSTGTKHTGIVFWNGAGPSDSGYYSNRFRHLMIPVNIGYHIHIGKKFSVMPEIGIAASYNFNGTTYSKTQIRNERHNFSPANSNFHMFSLFGSGQLNIQYVLNQMLALTLTPSFYYMLTNFDNPPSGAPFDPKEHPYAANVNIGLVINLNDRKSSAPTPVSNSQTQ